MTRLRVGLVLAATVSLLAGCRKTEEGKLNFTNAINTFYTSRPSCLWNDTVKFPIQADTSDTTKTSAYDALVDQGLLTRTSAEKKVFIVASKQVTIYDLSDKGRSAWTPDQEQPGYGNLCYGTAKVTSIDGYTPTNSEPGAITTVQYHTQVSGAPGWASAPETQNAFPSVRSALSGPISAIATLTDTSNGWVVTKGPGSTSRSPATAVDGTIVQ